MSNFTFIEYTGSAPAPVPQFGQATRILYRIGGKVRRLAIDSRDVPGFLSIYEGRQPVFRTVALDLPSDEEEPHDDADTPFDFTILSGIGPARAKTLEDADIVTKQQFLDKPASELAELLNANDKAVKLWKAAIA